MTEDIFRKRPIGSKFLLLLGQRLRDKACCRNKLTPQTNSNLQISGNNQNSNEQDTINMNNNMSLT